MKVCKSHLPPERIKKKREIYARLEVIYGLIGTDNNKLPDADNNKIPFRADNILTWSTKRAFRVRMLSYLLPIVTAVTFHPLHYVHTCLTWTSTIDYF